MAATKDNYYDISIKAGKKPNKAIIPPRRVSSQTSIPDLANNSLANAKDNKRPSDYYIQKLSSSCLNLSNGKRPISGDSILSLNSTYSDEISLNSLNDHPDSRLSSMTSNSISPNDSPNLSSVGQKSQTFNKPRKFTLEDTNVSAENLNQSLSTITSEKIAYGADTSMNSVTSLNSVSTSNFSSISAPTLTRSKTKYMSQEDIRNRQKLRKKQYDDSYNEDEILPDDISLVFNVPVIKNTNELYVQKKFRSNLIDDNNYKPFPLPGKLRSNSSPNIKTISSFNNTIEKVDEEGEDDRIEEEMGEIDADAVQGESTQCPNESTDSFDNEDSEITQNLSNYYSERSKSYSRLVQISRHENMMYKLPAYIKSQSSIDDLQFISPEKLNYIDQTRPINLPPKAEGDKVKHNKELQKMFKDFEKVNVSEYSISSASSKSNECDASWDGLLNKDNFNKRVVQDKNMVRKLNWDSNCPESERYRYFMKLLSFHDDRSSKIEENYHRLMHVYDNLNNSIKTNRNLEFDKIISFTLKKPIISSNVKDVESFRRDYSTLLFLKSIDNSLHKHDESFLIPMILALFPHNTLLEQFQLVELLDSEIFNKELVLAVNDDFSTWSTKLPKKIAKYLANFNLKEFDSLSFNKLFEILMQFNDKLPLSISATSGPISSSPVSCSLEVVYKFLQLLAVYNINSKTRLLNHKKIFGSLLVVVIKYYHINWLDINELIEDNKSIKLNFNTNNQINSHNFFEKWFNIFKNT